MEWFGGCCFKGGTNRTEKEFWDLEGVGEGRGLGDVQKKRPFQILRRSVRVKSRPDVR